MSNETSNKISLKQGRCISFPPFFFCCWNTAVIAGASTVFLDLGLTWEREPMHSMLEQSNRAAWVSDDVGAAIPCPDCLPLDIYTRERNKPLTYWVLYPLRSCYSHLADISDSRKDVNESTAQRPLYSMCDHECGWGTIYSVIIWNKQFRVVKFSFSSAMFHISL